MDCNTTEIACVVCNKIFTTTQLLKRHKERSPACLKWISNNSLLAQSTKSFIADIKNQ